MAIEILVCGVIFLGSEVITAHSDVQTLDATVEVDGGIDTERMLLEYPTSLPWPFPSPFLLLILLDPDPPDSCSLLFLGGTCAIGESETVLFEVGSGGDRVSGHLLISLVTLHKTRLIEHPEIGLLLALLFEDTVASELVVIVCGTGFGVFRGVQLMRSRGRWGFDELQLLLLLHLLLLCRLKRFRRLLILLLIKLEGRLQAVDQLEHLL